MNLIESFECDGACVQISTRTDGTLRMYIQLVDAYRYQRELIIEQDAKGKWTTHAYQHPGIRNIEWVSARAANNLIERIRELCRNHISLLFNAATPERPRHEGFVQFHHALLNYNFKTAWQSIA
jgi:hypothetical protein